MMFSSRQFSILIAALLATSAIQVEASQLRRLPAREGEGEGEPKARGPLFSRHPVGRRLQLNGGHMFVVSSQVSDGVEWCMDLLQGVWTTNEGKKPPVGLRPCAFMSGPTEQLFNPTSGSTGDGIKSSYDYDYCLSLGREGAVPQAGNKVRLDACQYGRNDFAYDEIAIWVDGEIRVASNPSLCVTFEGQNPDDDDRLILSPCEDTDKFKWWFRSGWYILGSGEGCVQVQDRDMEVGTPIVYDNCHAAGFSGHWRLDNDGLLHSRKDDNFCMMATAREEGAAIRLARCDDDHDSNQQWAWPDGFEAPITLLGTDFNLAFQGEDEESGEPMVLTTDGYGFSGDAVHV